MEPQDTHDMQARMNELLNTVFMHCFGDTDEDVTERAALAALADMFPKQWAEWLAFAGPGAATHFANFKPIRLAVDELQAKLFVRLFEEGRSTFTVDEAAAMLRDADPRMFDLWHDADPHALENELARLCRLGEMRHNDDGSYTPGPKITAAVMEEKRAAYRREAERLKAEADALDAELDFLTATGHFDNAGSPRGHAGLGKPDVHTGK